MGAIKKLAGETIIYGVSTILGRLLNYLLVPIYTIVFLTAEYGVVVELMSYAGFFNVIYLYGMETGFFRFASKGDMQKHFNICFTMVLLTSVLFSTLIILFATPLVNALDYKGQEIWIYMMSSIFLIDAVAAIPFASLRLKKKAIKFATIKFFGIVLTISLNLLFLIFIPYLIKKGGLPGFKDLFESIPLVSYIFVSNLLANTCMLLLLSKEIGSVRLHLERAALKKLFRYSLPILIIGLAGMTNENLSRLLLKHLLPVGIHGSYTNQEILGIFGACYKLSIFMTLAVQAFRFASEPFFFSNAADKKSPILFSRVMTAFVIFGSLVVFFVSINIHWIAPIFLKKPDYLTGLGVVPILLGANLALGIYYSLSVWYKLTDKTIYGAYIALAGAMITVTLNIVLIPKYGYMGSATATLTTYVTMTVISFFMSRKFLPIPYDLLKIMGYLFLTGAMTFIALNYMGEDLISTLFTNLIGFIVFGVLIIISEKSTIRQLLIRKASV